MVSNVIFFCSCSSWLGVCCCGGRIAVSITEAGVHIMSWQGAVRTHHQLVLHDAVAFGVGRPSPFVPDSPSRARIPLPDGAFGVASPWEALLQKLSFLGLHPGWRHAVVLWDHLVPGEAVSRFRLGLRSVPILDRLVLFSLLLEAFLFLDFIVP